MHSSTSGLYSLRGLRIVSAQATGGKVVSQVIDVKGCPAFVTTSCTPVIDEEMATRESRYSLRFSDVE